MNRVTMSATPRQRRPWAPDRWRALAGAALLASGLALGGCTTTGAGTGAAGSATATPKPEAPASAARTAPSGPRQVALLVPLSGSGAEVGRSLESAARAALTPARAGSIRLSVHDTAGTAEGAKAAAKAALDGGADLVLGPLFSASAQAARPLLTAAGVPALSFSNNSTIAGNGIYVLGDLPGQQTEALLAAAAKQGHGRVVMVGPDTAYSRLAQMGARAAQGSGGIQLIQSRLFPPNTTYNDQVQIVRSLARVGATGVVLPTSGLTLVGLAALFDYYDAAPPRVRMLGTSLWEWPGTFAEGSLHGGWYVSRSVPPTLARAPARPAPEPETAAPESEPEQMADQPDADSDADADAAGETADAAPAGPPPSAARKPDAPERPEVPEAAPVRLAAGPGKMERLAMDGIALAAAWAKAPGAPQLSAFLTDKAGFRGFSGLFRLTPTGRNERGLHLLEVTRDGPRLVQPAPGAFAGAGQPAMLIDSSDMGRNPWLAAEMRVSGAAPAATAAPSVSAPDRATPSTTAPRPTVTPVSTGGGCRWVRDCTGGECRSQRVCPPSS
jgi:hypothetical protein